jgi:hypothetical protein
MQNLNPGGAIAELKKFLSGWFEKPKPEMKGQA